MAQQILMHSQKHKIKYTVNSRATKLQLLKECTCEKKKKQIVLESKYRKYNNNNTRNMITAASNNYSHINNQSVLMHLQKQKCMFATHRTKYNTNNNNNNPNK